MIKDAKGKWINELELVKDHLKKASEARKETGVLAKVRTQIHIDLAKEHILKAEFYRAAYYKAKAEFAKEFCTEEENGKDDTV